ncbi:sulfite exporter TauE/SafE family protein [Robiginitalea aurantiaca]|mgnify:CR=1 FL=1|uniref:Probable membrane transporter protein n=1 Tax=Robiginitalea aurantiaca TaxID=3056915 RepID=A0ABT7WE48_9FLAO|nr:sulfite exporter TauE/SafE family protein [Robiginitalea aurantiaca]MDM9631183.1 sulfite exporter TauE/SafE family protein [Robiginitalea aurantiaca]
MLYFLFQPDQGTTPYLIALAGALVLGLAKSGLKGTGIFAVTLMALAFGARQSTGQILPLLMFGDLFAVLYYNRHARWDHLKRFIPWMVLGIVLGAWVGKDLPEQVFKWAMAVIILGSVLLMGWWDIRKSKRVPQHPAFAGFMGLAAGVTTMIGNLAGPFSNLYFLAMRLPKNEFIGTAAWLFLLTNWFKLPLHIFVWKTIDAEVLRTDLWLLPGVLVGLFAGVRLVRLIRDTSYRRIILFLTALGAILIMVQ